MSETANPTMNLELSNADQAKNAKTLFGFWVYIMTDCVLFASLFATYAVLHRNTFGGQSGETLFSLPNVLAETLILLTSSFTCGLGILAARARHKNKVIFWFLVTFVLGLAFLFLELTEFRHLVVTGNSWRRSGFLSSFFTLVGTHGLHISVGLLWLATLLAKITSGGLSKNNVRQLTIFSIFWHFLDIIWIFIFTIVYLMGALGK
jgi:cytochrome o ubiquinol oxidase subunit 3